jgi:hypothetical protein
LDEENAAIRRTSPLPAVDNFMRTATARASFDYSDESDIEALRGNTGTEPRGIFG